MNLFSNMDMNFQFLHSWINKLWIYIVNIYIYMLKMRPNHEKDIRDPWENECREQVMPVSGTIPFSPQFHSEWLSARMLSTLTWLNSDREKKTTFLAVGKCHCLKRKPQYLYSRKLMSKDKAISGPQAEISI